MVYSLKKENISSFLKNINDYKIYLPIEKDNDYELKLFAGEKVNLDKFVNTRMNFKEYFFPKSEKILKYKYQKSSVTTENTEIIPEKNLFFGVRPCDVHSLQILKKVFEWDYKDEFFLKRLSNSTFITYFCKNLFEGCFCTSLFNEKTLLEGTDIAFYDNNSEFLLEGLTQKGSELLKNNKALEEKEEAATIIKKIKESFFKNKNDVDYQKVSEWLEKNFENKVFDSYSLKCLSCGVCSYLCPTCHCFDIVDEGDNKKGVRLKNWDTCAFSAFTLHSSNHNPRKNLSNRHRQRLMHKFNYYKKKFDVISCVGCGRCIRLCPVSMDFNELFKKVSE